MIVNSLLRGGDGDGGSVSEVDKRFDFIDDGFNEKKKKKNNSNDLWSCDKCKWTCYSFCNQSIHTHTHIPVYVSKNRKPQTNPMKLHTKLY